MQAFSCDTQFTSDYRSVARVSENGALKQGEKPWCS